MHRILRIALYSFAIATCLVFFLVKRFDAQPAHPEAVDDGPWIPLPSSGMDAQSWELRRTLLSHAGGRMDPVYRILPSDTLALECGQPRPSGQKLPDIYIATVSSGGGAESGIRRLQAEFSVWGDAVVVRTYDTRLPSMSTEQLLERAEILRAGTESRFTRRQLAPIARAWQAPGLWHEPQGAPYCLDGRTIVLEACVADRYALRNRGCAAIGSSGSALWNEIQKLPRPKQAIATPAVGAR